MSSRARAVLDPGGCWFRRFGRFVRLAQTKRGEAAPSASIDQRFGAEFVVIVNPLHDGFVRATGFLGPLRRIGFAAGDHVKGKVTFASPGMRGMELAMKQIGQSLTPLCRIGADHP